MAETKDRVRVGVIGVGNYASSYHVPNLLANPSAHIQAISDASAERLAAAAAVTSVAPERLYADHRQMIEAEALDAVTVSSPHALHADHVRAALERGLHVLVDKPFVLRSAEARELIQLAEARGTILLVALNRHLDPSNLYARDLIRSGEIGEPVFARSLQVAYPPGGFYA
ncbi:MAG: Gfo/Idh/MocA family oxidoreductase, partial [Chloroflexota bacterium]|nr:Gfo/Idh/MocA family oxidoreductase [Chloroflexota bacterium]